MIRDRYVAVGLLTQRDLDLLGSGFQSAFPVPDGDAFDDLLRAIDEAAAKAEQRATAGSDRADRSGTG